jgi:hypothetical protein
MTIIIDKQRLIDLKRLAVERRMTLSAIVDEFLRDGLARSARKNRKQKLLPRGKNMGRMLVDISNRRRLYEVLDGR